MYEVIPTQNDVLSLSQFSKTPVPAKPYTTPGIGPGSPAYDVTLGGAAPPTADTGSFYLSSVIETLIAKLDEYYGNFAQQAADEAEVEAAGKAVYAFEASVHASIKVLIEENTVTASGNGQLRQYQSRSLTVEAEIDVRVSAYRQVSNESFAMDADYFSPENTARRIMDFAAGFFHAYANRHPEMNNEEAAAAFGELVRNAVTTGFNEALAILGALPDSVMEMIRETYDLLMEMLDEMFGSAQ